MVVIRTTFQSPLQNGGLNIHCKGNTRRFIKHYPVHVSES